MMIPTDRRRIKIYKSNNLGFGSDRVSLYGNMVITLLFVENAYKHAPCMVLKYLHLRFVITDKHKNDHIFFSELN